MGHITAKSLNRLGYHGGGKVTSTNIPVIRLVEGERTLSLMRWGLVPPWAKDTQIGYKMINARA